MSNTIYGLSVYSKYLQGLIVGTKFLIVSYQKLRRDVNRFRICKNNFSLFSWSLGFLMHDPRISAMCLLYCDKLTINLVLTFYYIICMVTFFYYTTFRGRSNKCCIFTIFPAIVCPRHLEDLIYSTSNLSLVYIIFRTMMVNEILVRLGYYPPHRLI